MSIRKKISKLGILFKNRSTIRKSFDQIFLSWRIKELLEKYRRTELKQVLPIEFFSKINNYKITRNLNLFSDFMNGSSPVIDYFFLCHCAKALNIKNFFEIGTWVGLSAYNVSLNTDPSTNIYTLDIPSNHPDIKEYDIPEIIFGYHSKKVRNINHLKGDSRTFDFSPYAGTIDLIFIDGNHSLEFVMNDSRKAFEILSNDNTIIFWHDYLIQGNVNYNVLCGILEGIPENEHGKLFHLSQSNMAVYSKSIDFFAHSSKKWELPELSFDLDFRLRY